VKKSIVNMTPQLVLAKELAADHDPKTMQQGKQQQHAILNISCALKDAADSV
jgi:hypothetical protein